MFPDNSTGLSLAGALKWIAIIIGGVYLFQAYQGIILQIGSTGRVGDLLTGREAQTWGLYHLLYAGIAFAVSWAVWFFWQRNED